MLDSLFIANEASYDAVGQSLSPCTSVNFIYGSNGSGKTTISRVLSNPGRYTDCKIKWKADRALEVLVYNVDFVKANFTSTMPGIFTLGQASAEVELKIAKIDEQREDVARKGGNLRKTLEGSPGAKGKVDELADLRKRFEEDCWKSKLKHESDFMDMFKGSISSRAAFADKLLQEYNATPATTDTLDTLRTRTQTVFQKGLDRYNTIGPVRDITLTSIEASPIFRKVIVGKDNVDLAGLIAKLKMSDWVKQGRGYLEGSGNDCPFCQQPLLIDLKAKMEDYFDEKFACDSEQVKSLSTDYERRVDAFQTKLKSVRQSHARFFNVETFEGAIEKFSHRADNNQSAMRTKSQNLSTPVEIAFTSSIMDQLVEMVDKAEKDIATHNSYMDNIRRSKDEVKAQVWKALVELDRTMIETFLDAKSKLDKAIAKIRTQIAERQKQYSDLNRDRRELERQLTGVQSTVDEMNGILSKFGFRNFKLETAGDRGENYKIVRENGNDASATLSEGEKNFVAFLYFFHLLKGSMNQSGVAEHRVVVIDDPISSLDSDILFIVSNLVKQIILDVCGTSSHLKQIFILTHNVYFHKEVSFDSRRSQKCMSHESFWIVRKYDHGSAIVNFDYNPVKTSYELLWHEARDPHNASITIQNTLRRVIENYFRVFGNISIEKILAEFDGYDKTICQTLLSWVNDGSHSVHDDMYVTVDEATVVRYKDIFKQIFYKTGHKGHYDMMMGTSA